MYIYVFGSFYPNKAIQIAFKTYILSFHAFPGNWTHDLSISYRILWKTFKIEMNSSPQKFIADQYDFLSQHNSCLFPLPVVGSWLLREAPCGRVGCGRPDCGSGCDCFLSVPGPDESPSSYGWALSRLAWVPCWTAPLHSQATQPV